MTDNIVRTPEETEALPPGQWVIDATGANLCLVDTHMGWPQRMFMTPGASSFVAVDHVAYPLQLADIADEEPCPHRWGANECGHCRRCGVVTTEARPMYFEPFAEAVVHMAAEHNSRLPKGDCCG